jgi:hypothetical protein
MLLAGGFCVFGAIYFYTKIRRRKRNNADLQPDVALSSRRENRSSRIESK